jgi:prepilin-type N-terminal cleavage/methylation domain-containing protein/prepilin-type processing-associated H-X9-DG protein
MKKKGFTLIELLVVIAIIALLLSVVMPALRKVKDTAHFLVCRSNLRQLATAINTYTVENKGSFITYYNWSGPSVANTLWIDAIGKYASNVSKIRYCPKAEVPTQDALNKLTAGIAGYYQGTAQNAWSLNTNSVYGTQYGTGGNVFYQSEGSYTYNGYLYVKTGIAATDDNLGSYAGGIENLFNTISSVTLPAMVPVLVDGIWPDMWPTPGELPHPQAKWPTGYRTGSHYMSRILIDRHNKRLGVAFLDGHAESIEIVKDLQLWNLRWRNNWTLPSEGQVLQIMTALNTMSEEVTFRTF